MTPRTKAVDVLPDGRHRQVAYGDFQTPPGLAQDVCQMLGDQRPRTIVEPTCGTGTFLAAAIRRFPGARRALAFDVNAQYVAAARQCIAQIPCISQIPMRIDSEIRVGDFFRKDWRSVLSRCADPILIIGNPPRVNNAIA